MTLSKGTFSFIFESTFLFCIVVIIIILIDAVIEIIVFGFYLFEVGKEILSEKYDTHLLLASFDAVTNGDAEIVPVICFVIVEQDECLSHAFTSMSWNNSLNFFIS